MIIGVTYLWFGLMGMVCPLPPPCGSWNLSKNCSQEILPVPFTPHLKLIRITPLTAVTHALHLFENLHSPPPPSSLSWDTPLHHLPEELIRHGHCELAQDRLEILQTDEAIQVSVKGQEDLFQVQVILSHLQIIELQCLRNILRWVSNFLKLKCLTNELRKHQYISWIGINKIC